MVTQLPLRKLVRRTGLRAAMRHPAGWHIAMLLAALGFVLRALVPVGFMPDAQALQNGHIELTLCSPGAAAVGRSITLSLLSDDSRDTSHPAGSLATPVDCPFGLMAAQAVVVPPAIGVAAVASPSFPRSRPLAPRAASLPVQGPPLGSRAPPAVA